MTQFKLRLVWGLYLALTNKQISYKSFKAK